MVVVLRPTALAESICMALSRKGEIKPRDYERNKSPASVSIWDDELIARIFFLETRKSGLIANESNNNMSPSEL